MTPYLHDVTPIPTLIVTPPDDIHASVNGGRAVPRPFHRPLRTRCPLIGSRVVTVRLPEVRHPSTPTCYVNPTIRHSSGMGIHLNRIRPELKKKIKRGGKHSWQSLSPSCGQSLCSTSVSEWSHLSLQRRHKLPRVGVRVVALHRVQLVSVVAPADGVNMAARHADAVVRVLLLQRLDGAPPVVARVVPESSRDNRKAALLVASADYAF